MSFSYFLFFILPVISKNIPIHCAETYTSVKGDTCFDVAVAFGLNLTELEDKYDCDKFQVGTNVCVSEKPTCQLRFIMNHEAEVTCELLKSAYKISEAEIEEYNGGIKCDSLPAGRRMCVWTADDPKLPNTVCTQWETVQDRGLGCKKLSRKFNLPLDHFMFLNPRVNCDEMLRVGTQVCVKDKSRVPCSKIVDVESSLDSCDKFRKQHNLTETQLMEWNPTLKCTKFQEYGEICVELAATD